MALELWSGFHLENKVYIQQFVNALGPCPEYRPNPNVGLSQGQKQLLCITRVMLCLPPMLILDEATSSIDTRTELQIQEAFDQLMQGRTSFIVAHRLSTIRNADWILVMKDGQIIEQGTHDDLMKEDGFYNHLYNSQFVNVAQ